VGFFRWLKSLFSRKKSDGPIAFVWLLDRPRHLDLDTVRRIVGQAVGVQIPAEPEADSECFVIGEPPSMMVKIPDYMLLVNCVPAPYVDNPSKAADSVSELRLKKILQEHQAWVSADLFGDYDEEQTRRGYGIIGKIAADMAGDDCLALYMPHADRMVPYAPELLEALRSDDPLAQLGWEVSPVVQISEDDPRMKAAVAEARARWPEFVQAFEHPSPQQSNFAVKLPMAEHGVHLGQRRLHRERRDPRRPRQRAGGPPVHEVRRPRPWEAGGPQRLGLCRRRGADGRFYQQGADGAVVEAITLPIQLRSPAPASRR
jgi:hypothetical protein